MEVWYQVLLIKNGSKEHSHDCHGRIWGSPLAHIRLAVVDDDAYESGSISLKLAI